MTFKMRKRYLYFINQIAFIPFGDLLQQNRRYLSKLRIKISSAFCGICFRLVCEFKRAEPLIELVLD